MLMLTRFLALLWPFLKEMFLGDKTASQAIRDSKGKVLVVAIILLSIVLNFFTIPRLFTISAEYVILKKKHDETENEIDDLKKQLIELSSKPPVRPVLPSETASAPVEPASTPKPPVAEQHKPVKPSGSRSDRARQAFEQMQKQESNTP